MPTVEERLAALEKQMAAWMDQRPTTYYTHQYSGEEIDAAVGRALTGGALDTSVGNVSKELGTFVRPNLLDNWCFGRPVDQRGGYVVYAGANLYTDASCTTIAGQVSGGPYAARAISAICVSFASNATYYCKIGDTGVVRGYTGNGYTVDRWITDGKPVTIGSGIGVEAVSFLYQKLEQSTMDVLHGKQITFSALTTSNGFVTGSWVVDNANQSDTRIAENSELILFRSPWTGNGWGLNAKTATHILAAKLELGPTQTLAHQDAAGNWVLNEVPEYGGQLRRCQRYFVRYTFDTQRFIGVLNIDSANGGQGYINVPVPMRATPIISGPLGVYSADNNIQINISIVGSKGGLIWINAAPVSPFVNAPKMGLLYAQTTLDISADL